MVYCRLFLDFDRMMMETMQAAPTTLQGPAIDLEVPPMARQKFEQRVASQSVNTDGGGDKAIRIALMVSGRKREGHYSMASFRLVEGIIGRC